MLKRLLARFSGAVMLPGAAIDGPFEDGQAAFEREDYAGAVKLLRAPSDQSDAFAQRMLS